MNTALRDPKTAYQVDVGTDFTRYPAGRDPDDGPYNGQVFREKYLEPRLKNHEKVVVKLDGALDYGSSFLEEAFGGLIRHGYPKADVLSLIELQSDDPLLKQEILGYIETAKPPG